MPERGDDVLYMMAGAVVSAWSVRASRVADEALVVLVFQMTDDTEPLWVVETTRRCRRQVALSTNQKVACGRVAAALLTRARPRPAISRSLTNYFCTRQANHYYHHHHHHSGV